MDLEVADASARLGRKTVLEHVSLRLHGGEVAGVMGPNGSGKTTLLRLVGGLVAPASGEVRALDAQGERCARWRCGYMMEVPPFAEKCDGVRNLQMLARLGGEDPGEAASLMRRVGLDPESRLPVEKYSQGMRKRLGFAQAILGSPDVVILDEPMNGLDPVGKMLFERIIAHVASGGATVVVSSHDLGGLARMCSVVYVVCEGGVRRVKDKYLSEQGLRDAYLSIVGGWDRAAAAGDE